MFVKTEATPVEKQPNKLLLQVNNQMIIVEDSEALADILGTVRCNTFFSLYIFHITTNHIKI